MKQFRKKSVIALILLIVGGCSEGERDFHGKSNSPPSESAVKVQKQQPQILTAEELLMQYLDAGLKAGVSGKSKETYRLISSKDKEATPQDEYLSSGRSSDPDVSHELVTAMMSTISYTIKNAIIEEDKAKIEVEMSVPRLPASLRNAIGKKRSPELEGKVISYLNSPDLQFDKNVQDFNLVKESVGWKVFLDFATSKKIKLLVEEAEKLAPSLEMLSPIDGSVLVAMKSDLLLAKEKYKEALALGESFSAENNLKYLEKQIKKLNVYEQIKVHVQVRNVHVGEGRYGGKGVFGEVKNNSNAALKKVGITIYFLDANGNPVHEMSYHPIYVTERSYGDDAIPLKPNYSRKFGYKADDAPYDWSEEVKVVISDVEAE